MIIYLFFSCLLEVIIFLLGPVVQGLKELLLQLSHRGLKAVSVGQLARLAQMEAIDPMIEAHL